MSRATCTVVKTCVSFIICGNTYGVLYYVFYSGIWGGEECVPGVVGSSGVVVLWSRGRKQTWVVVEWSRGRCSPWVVLVKSRVCDDLRHRPWPRRAATVSTRPSAQQTPLLNSPSARWRLNDLGLVLALVSSTSTRGRGSPKLQVLLRIIK